LPFQIMHTVFIVCAALGIATLAIQIVLSAFGIGEDGLHLGESGVDEGFELLSVRSVAAGAGFFGLAGLGATAANVVLPLALIAAGVAGLGALVGTAFLMRQILRLDSDGSLRLENAVGLAGTVYLPIPPDRSGHGKVQFALQGRTVEMGAVTPVAEGLATGAPVVVVSIVDSDTVEVVPISLIEEAM
jgi:hypothetical protein